MEEDSSDPFFTSEFIDGTDWLEATAALDLARHAGDDGVRVAVIDVLMPGMTGDELLARLRAIDPRLPAVLVSGFADRRVMGGALGPRTEFLQKPFHPEELVTVVRRVLAAG